MADPHETRSEVDICIDKALLNVLLISGPLSCRGGGRVARGVAGWCYCAAQAKQAVPFSAMLFVVIDSWVAARW